MYRGWGCFSEVFQGGCEGPGGDLSWVPDRVEPLGCLKLTTKLPRTSLAEPFALDPADFALALSGSGTFQAPLWLPQSLRPNASQRRFWKINVSLAKCGSASQISAFGCLQLTLSIYVLARS
jgi:hypothetical protein